MPPRPVPQEVWDAMDTYQYYKNQFDSLTFKVGGNINTGAGTQAASSGIANDCGTSQFDVPDFIYTSACNNHDICYASSTPKATCDAAFSLDMKTINEALLGTITSFEELFVAGLLEVTSDIYFEAVNSTYEATIAYCNATSNPNASECQPNSQNLSLGRPTGYENRVTSGINNRTYTFSCELWQFPDGTGSYYYLRRNCSIVSITP